MAASRGKAASANQLDGAGNLQLSAVSTFLRGGVYRFMRRMLSLVAVLCTAFVAACDTPSRPQISPTEPSRARLPGPPESLLIRDAPATAITLGQIVEDVINPSDPPCTIVQHPWPVPCRHFLVTAPASGTLVAKVTWDVDYTGMLLMLRMGETDFPPTGRPWSPHVGRMKTVAGQQYRVAVGLAGSDWFGGPFVLTTSMEP